jgi:hypothetical protein
MEPQVEKGRWLVIDGPDCTEHIPADLIGEPRLGGFSEEKRKAFKECDEYAKALFARAEDYRENRKFRSCEFVEGYGARFSAPGYLDATDWAFFDSEAEAIKYLLDQHLEDNPECKVTFSGKLGDHDVDGDVINPGAWFGKTWLLEIGGSYSPIFVVVEADSCTDAIDELSGDDKYKHHILIPPEDFGDYGQSVRAGDQIGGRTFDSDCFINLRGEEVAEALPEPYWNDGGEACDLDHLGIHGQEGIANGKGMPFPCTYHVEDFGDVSPLTFA